MLVRDNVRLVKSAQRAADGHGRGGGEKEGRGGNLQDGLVWTVAEGDVVKPDVMSSRWVLS